MNLLLRLHLAGLCLALSSPVVPAAEIEDLDAIEKRIAKRVEEMQDKDPSTAGIVAAIDWEEQQWDALMNSAYRNLLAKLPEKARDSLRASQRAWLAFRDAEQRAQSSLFSTRDGTMYIPMAADARMRIVKHRATDLASLARVLAIDDE